MRGDGVTFVEDDDIVSCSVCLAQLDSAIAAARTERKKKYG
jgi:hypothetical protein